MLWRQTIGRSTERLISQALKKELTTNLPRAPREIYYAHADTIISNYLRGLLCKDEEDRHA
jgi:hypothetical protein